MIVENFIRLYAHDFSQMAGRAEMGQDVDEALARRVRDADNHAQVMDRVMRHGADPAEAAERRQVFLSDVADTLEQLRAARAADAKQPAHA